MTPTVKAVRDWLLTCPAISDAADFGVSINFLDSEAVQFSIEESPGVPVLKRFFSGALKTKNFAVTSRLYFDELQAQQLENSGLIEAITDWVEEQNDLRRFPVLDDGKEPRQVEITSTGYLISEDGSTCRFQFQIGLIFYQKKGSASA